jgi:hypothetical protein
MSSNYLGRGKRYDGGAGIDVAVSRGPAGDWMYDFEPMRREAERQREKHSGATIRFVCPLNNVTVAGFEGTGGPLIYLQLGSRGFLTKPIRILRDERGTQ